MSRPETNQATIDGRGLIQTMFARVGAHSKGITSMTTNIEAVNSFNLTVQRGNLGLVLADDLSESQCDQIGEQLLSLTQNLPWLWGDFLNIGKKTYGTKYTAAVERFGLNLQTAKQYSSVAAKFPQSCRRLHLSWSHHQAVASITDETERNRLLTLAEDQRWPLARLRDEAKARPALTVDRDVMPDLTEVMAFYRDQFDGVHEANMVLPTGTDREFRGLVASFRKYGQEQPIIRSSDRMLLDGKRRLMACFVTGITPAIIDDDGIVDPWQLNYSLNVCRQHLTEEQMDEIERMADEIKARMEAEVAG